MDVIPSPYEFVLLALAAYRLWRLISEDEVLEKPRRWLVRLPQTWDEGDAIPKQYRNEWALFLTCPWCAGAWVSLVSYIGWMFTIGQAPNVFSEFAVAGGVWFAVSASVGLIRVRIDPPET